MPYRRHRRRIQANTLLEAPNPYATAALAYAHNFVVGTPLKQIFKSEGEWGFRVREATALLDVVRQRGDVVVATGRGAARASRWARTQSKIA